MTTASIAPLALEIVATSLETSPVETYPLDVLKREDAITGFFGEYRYMSNFWYAKVRLDSTIYPTVEHAYQAA